jgi:hypothetical protein
MLKNFHVKLTINEFEGQHKKKKVLLSLNKTSGSHTIVYSFGLQFSDFCLCTRDDVQPSPQPILEHFHYLKKKT